MSPFKKQKHALPYLILGAVLTGFTLIFPVLGFLEWVSMIPLFIGAYRLGSARYSAKRSYCYGFLTVLSFYLVIYHWFIALYPLDFVDMDMASSLVVILAGWLGLSLLQAIPGGLIFLFFKLFHKTPLFRRAPLLRPFVLSAFWIVFEWSSTLSWTGVPWGRLCLGQIDYLAMLQTASLFGSYFVSFLLLVVNGLLAYVILYRLHMKRRVICIATAALLIVGNLGLGFVLLETKKEPEGTVSIGVVQGNISSHDKWSSESYSISQQTYGELTRAAAKDGAEIVLWPETAFPYTLNLSSNLRSFVSDLAVECNITLILGALYTDDAGRDYNVLYLIRPDGEIDESVYAKRHLVPFGEYVPMRKLIMTLIPPLADLSALDSDLFAGTDSALFETEWGKLGSLICFDSIYEQLARDSVLDGANLLLLSSNDSWFKDSAAIYQHESQARLRAIEAGRYLVRAGNTGISSVINEKGEHLSYIDALERGYIVQNVELHTTDTLYTHCGSLTVYISLIFLACITFLAVKARKCAIDA